MLANSLCGDSDSSDSVNKAYFRSFRTMHSGHMPREGARPEIVRDNMGHANIDVTQNVYSKSWPVAHSTRFQWATRPRH